MNCLYDSDNPDLPPLWLGLVRIVPATGAVIEIQDGVTTYIMKPVATIAAASVKFPPKPKDHQLLRILTTQEITTLTLVPGATQTISGAPVPALMAANTAKSYVYSKLDNTWYKLS